MYLNFVKMFVFGTRLKKRLNSHQCILHEEGENRIPVIQIKLSSCKNGVKAWMQKMEVLKKLHQIISIYSNNT